MPHSDKLINVTHHSDLYAFLLVRLNYSYFKHYLKTAIDKTLNVFAFWFMSLFDGVEDRYFLVYDFAYVAEFKNVRIEDATFLGPVSSAWIALQLTLLDQFHQNNRRGVLFLFTSLKKMSWSSDKPALSQGLQRPSIEGREAAKIPMAWVYPVPCLLVCLVTPPPTPPLLYCHQLVCSVLLGDGDPSWCSMLLSLRQQTRTVLASLQPHNFWTLGYHSARFTRPQPSDQGYPNMACGSFRCKSNMYLKMKCLEPKIFLLTGKSSSIIRGQ